MLSLSGTDSPRGRGQPLQIDSHRRRARPLHPGGEEDQRPEQRRPDDGVRATEPAMGGTSLHGRSRPAELERRSDRRSRSWSRSPGVRHGAALPQTWRRAATELEPGGHGDQRISGGWGLRRASEPWWASMPRGGWAAQSMDGCAGELGRMDLAGLYGPGKS